MEPGKSSTADDNRVLTVQSCCVRVRQPYDESRASRRARLQREPAAMPLGNPPGNRQPEPGTAVSAGAGDADEPLEDPLAVGGLDAWTGVGHRDLDCVRAGTELGRHAPTRRSVRHGVLEEVDEQLPQKVLVSHERHIRLADRAQLDTTLVRQHTDRARALGQQLAEVDRAALERPGAGVGSWQAGTCCRPSASAAEPVPRLSSATPGIPAPSAVPVRA